MTSTAIGRFFFALGAMLTGSVVHYGKSRDSVRVRYTDRAEEDRIESLPGLGYKPGFGQFSGYLDVAPTRSIFYVFVESQSNPESDPVVLWTNGGPGCSGLLGWGAEHGPYHITGKGHLHENTFSWNKIANMLYIEQPAGVGFSYTDTERDMKTGDKQAANDNYALIKAFFKRFPERQSNPFYIASESYGGHYIPQLAHEILKKDADRTINFKGFLLGNPFVDPYSNMVAEFEAYYYHGLLPKPMFDDWLVSCKGHRNWDTRDCQKVIETIQGYSDHSSNPYALDYPMCVEVRPSVDEEHDNRRALREVTPSGNSQNVRQKPKGVSSVQADILFNRTAVLPPFSPEEDLYQPCAQLHLKDYLNRHDVQTSLHVNRKKKTEWSPCTLAIDYSFEDVMTPTIPIIKQLVEDGSSGKHDLKMLIFSGDDDSVCATSGTQSWLWSLGFPAKTVWSRWTVDDQTAGFLTRFDLGASSNASFAFMTVHGAGHEVPAYRPKEALELFRQFLTGEAFG